jgi:hypothetical protein
VLAAFALVVMATCGDSPLVEEMGAVKNETGFPLLCLSKNDNYH